MQMKSLIAECPPANGTEDNDPRRKRADSGVNGTGVFNINESLTLDGAQLTRASGADINLPAGKTLTVQNGGDAIITGVFINNSASTIAVTSAGSTFSTTSSLQLIGGSDTTVSAGGSLTAGTGLTNVRATGALNINAGGTMIVR